MTLADRIATWLPHARWFAAKGEPLAAVTLYDEAALPGTDLVLTLVDVRTAAGADSRYVAPLDDATGHDAAATREFADWLVRTVLGAKSLATRHGSFSGHRVSGVAAVAAGQFYGRAG